MAQALLLLTVLVSIGLSVQQLQTLKDPEFVALGGTVTLSCRYNSGNIGDSNYPLWVQQKPGSKPRLVMHHTSTRPSDVPARFSGSKSGNMMSLTITGAQTTPSYSPRIAQVLLFFTVLVSVGSSVQQLQTLKDPEFVALGGTVTLSCRYNSGNIGDNNYPLWVQQKPGSQPRLVMHHTSTRPSDVPARFSGSKSGNVMSLTITGAQVEDEAVYYCCVYFGGVLHRHSFRWGIHIERVNE
ncbi:immunoglobulin kappa light chain-like [Elgaria multicarinata webbii]|uniref:immunoglobulin kappa light chain-like n=1 Tax=Elgaria multicarinata webbii TaxID=159646 RepID=UPI002FCD681E